MFYVCNSLFYLDEWGGGHGVQLCPLGMSATSWPTIVPVLGDYEGGEFGGMMIVWGNRSTRRKSATLSTTNPT
jgi:hypothetical protein